MFVLRKPTVKIYQTQFVWEDEYWTGIRFSSNPNDVKVFYTEQEALIEKSQNVFLLETRPIKMV